MHKTNRMENLKFETIKNWDNQNKDFKIEVIKDWDPQNEPSTQKISAQ